MEQNDIIKKQIIQALRQRGFSLHETVIETVKVSNGKIIVMVKGRFGVDEFCENIFFVFERYGCV